MIDPSSHEAQPRVRLHPRPAWAHDRRVQAPPQEGPARRSRLSGLQLRPPRGRLSPILPHLGRVDFPIFFSGYCSRGLNRPILYIKRPGRIGIRS